MNNIRYYNLGIGLLKSILRQRKYLLKHHAGHIGAEMSKKECANLEYHIPRLNTALKVRNYLQRRECILRQLIPSTNRKNQRKLTELIQTNITTPFNPSRKMSEAKINL